MNVIKAKRRLKKTLKRRYRDIQKDRTDRAFWNIFKAAGIVDREWER